MLPNSKKRWVWDKGNQRMSMAGRVLFFTITLMGLIVSNVAAAFAGNSYEAKRWSDESQRYVSQMLETKALLQQVDSTEWPEAMLAKYQMEMSSSVFYAAVAYVAENNRLPSDLTDLVGSYLSEWPENPQRDWQPVEVLLPGDPFTAGDLVLQVCPSSEYSLAGSFTNPRFEPMSFVLSSFGPSERHIQGCTGHLVNAKHWAQEPLGVVTVLEYYREPASVTLEKVQEWLDWQLEEAKQQAEPAGVEEE